MRMKLKIKYTVNSCVNKCVAALKDEIGVIYVGVHGLDNNGNRSNLPCSNLILI